MKGFYLREPFPYRIFERLNTDYDAHFHEQVEMCCCVEGSVGVMIDGESYVLQPGDCSVAFPNSYHSFVQTSQPADGKSYLILFPPEQTEEYYAEYTGMQPVCPVVRKEELPPETLPFLAHFCRLFTEGMDERLFKAYVGLITAYLLPRMALKLRQTAYSPETAQTVLNYVGQHFREPLSLTMLSKELGISTSALSGIFSKQLDTSFTEYVNTQRLAYAKKQLRNSDRELKLVIARSGFKSARTFFRVFQKETGMTPIRYRNAHRSNSTKKGGNRKEDNKKTESQEK